MLEGCLDLRACEVLLEQQSRSVELLGDLPFTGADVDHLAALLRHGLATQGVRPLARMMPASLACFLVWKGITGYREGDYWSAVWESLGLTADPNREVVFGQAFLAFLETRELPRFDVPGGLTYVTPILAHGGIPNACLASFFTQVLLPLERRLYDPTDRQEIADELALLRDDAAMRSELEQQLGRHHGQLRDLNDRIRRLESVAAVFAECMALWQEEERLAAYPGLSAVAADFETRQQELLTQIASLHSRIGERKAAIGQCHATIGRFTPADRDVLAQADSVDACRSALPSLAEARRALVENEALVEEIRRRLATFAGGMLEGDWLDDYGDILTGLDLRALHDAAAAVRSLDERVRSEQPPRALPAIAADERARGPGFRALVAGVAALCFLYRAFRRRQWGWLVLAGVLVVRAARRRVTATKRLALHCAEQMRTRRRIANVVCQRDAARDGFHRLCAGLPVRSDLLDAGDAQTVEDIGLLAQLWSSLQVALGEASQLRQQVDHLRRRINETTLALGMQISASEQETVDALTHLVSRARRHESAAAAAQGRLEELESGLTKDERDLRQLLIDLAALEKPLRELGQGDVQAGLTRYRELMALRHDITSHRERLVSEHAGFEDLEREARLAVAHGQSADTLAQEAEALRAQVSALHATSRDCQRELEACPSVLPGVDEPVRRYIVHAGNHAERVIVECLGLLHAARTAAPISAQATQVLPERMRQALGAWWDAMVREEGDEQSGDDDTGSGEESYRTPVLCFEPGAAEVVVRFPAQRYAGSAVAGTPTLTLFPSPAELPTLSVPLRALSRGNGLVETQEIDAPLPEPSSVCVFELSVGDQVLRRWEVQGLGEAPPYMAFDAGTGRALHGGAMPRSLVWLVCHGEPLAQGQPFAIESVALWGHWREFTAHLCNLTQCDEIVIAGSDGALHRMPVGAVATSEPALVGMTPIDGVSSSGSPVFVGQLPSLRLPSREGLDTSSWRISVIPETTTGSGPRRHWRLGDLLAETSVSTGDGWLDIPLASANLIGPRAFGRYAIRLHRPPHDGLRWTLCIMPTLEIAFDKAIYVPYHREKHAEAHVRIITPSGTRFVPMAPAYRGDGDSERYPYTVACSEPRMCGLVRWGSESSAENAIPLDIELPRLVWRLQGLPDSAQTEWRCTVDEVWIGDWISAPELSLVVSVPPGLKGRLELRLSGSASEAEQIIMRRMARFDLKRYTEELAEGPAIRSLEVLLPDRLEPSTVELLNVRTRWEVTSVECQQRVQGEAVVLALGWTEAGRTDGRARAVHVWTAPPQDRRIVASARLAEGATFELSVPAERIPPGPYDLQFVLRDPWRSSTPVPPAAGAPSTFRIQVIRPRDVRQGERIALHTVRKLGLTAALPVGAYTIVVIGRIINAELPAGLDRDGVLVKRINEGWYVGRLETCDPARIPEVARSNPVKIEYDAQSNTIRTLEDRHGEGAGFCLYCRVLSWSEESLRKHRGEQHTCWVPVDDFEVHWNSRAS